MQMPWPDIRQCLSGGSLRVVDSAATSQFQTLIILRMNGTWKIRVPGYKQNGQRGPPHRQHASCPQLRWYTGATAKVEAERAASHNGKMCVRERVALGASGAFERAGQQHVSVCMCACVSYVLVQRCAEPRALQSRVRS
mmetsp:Transcript_16419/g.57392  ORF Transcript_16419/g.57392 Transcript_16419/m.57392 type:complete len:139 (+) Transcript_16419:199-615(+)